MYIKMDILRKAGQAIADFDAAYAERVQKDTPGFMPLTTLLGGLPVSKVEASPANEAAMYIAQSKKGPASMGQVRRHQAVEQLLGYGVMGTNVGYRYGLPAAGVTAAAAGIHGLVNQGNTTQGELPL